MIKLIWDKPFKKRFKKYISKNPDSLENIINKLAIFVNEPFHPELRNHKLSGNLKELRAICIEYDLRIIYKEIDDSKALLVDIGTHDDVY